MVLVIALALSSGSFPPQVRPPDCSRPIPVYAYDPHAFSPVRAELLAKGYAYAGDLEDLKKFKTGFFAVLQKEPTGTFQFTAQIALYEKTDVSGPATPIESRTACVEFTEDFDAYGNGCFSAVAKIFPSCRDIGRDDIR